MTENSTGGFFGGPSSARQDDPGPTGPTDPQADPAEAPSEDVKSPDVAGETTEAAPSLREAAQAVADGYEDANLDDRLTLMARLRTALDR